MATITVTTLNDTVDANDGVTSLREALATAAANVGADTINFTAGMSGTITLNSALAVNSDVAISGDTNADNKADITIDGGLAGLSGLTQAQYHRVLDISGSVVALNALTVTGGVALTGGGINVAAGSTVTIDHSTVTGNSVSGIEGGVAVSGGGIANAGTLTVTNSAIYDNLAYAGTGQNATGAGISNTGTLTVQNTTFATNTASGTKGLGAAIGNVGGTVTVDHVTATGNVATYSTSTGLPGLPAPITSFGGVYSSGGTLTLTDSILVGNVAQKGTNSAASDVSSGVTYTGLNVIGIGTDTNAADHVIQTANAGLVFQTTVNGGLSLNVAGQLADNGGPVKTVALHGDRYNPAIDAASAGAHLLDATGTTAHDDPNIANRDTSARDLGAYELTADTPANSAPVMTGDRTAAMKEGGAYYLTQSDLYFTDVDILDDEQHVTFTVSGMTNGTVKLNGAVTNSFTAFELRTGQVGFVHNGSETVAAGFNVTVDDDNEDASAPVSAHFNFTVAKVNDAPRLAKVIADLKLPVHTDYSLNVANNFTDAESALTFSGKLGNGAALPAWLKVAADGQIALTPPADVSGTFAVTVIAKDTGGLTASDTFNIVIPKKPPEQSGNNFTGSGAGNVINAGGGNNTVDSGDGSDTVYTGSGNDVVKLGPGDDTATLGWGNDKCDGEAGNDTILGNKGNDTIYGGDGKDYIEDPYGSNVIYGGAGDDSIVAVGKLYGDAGNDYIIAAFNGTEAHGGTGNDEIKGYPGDQKLFGDAGDDTLYGYYYLQDSGNDELHGGTGNDHLYGGRFADKLYGDAGNDTLTGGKGLDTMHGGSGDDTLYGDGNGGTSGDLLYGEDGNDKLYGQSGNDKIYGGAGIDILDGSNGNDTLQGDAGADTLVGGTGIDRLTGGAGADTFRFSALSAEIDIITDFEVGVDKLSLPTAYAGSTLAAFGAAQTATDRLIYYAATGKLYYDADANGSGAAVQFAQLGTTTHPAITIADFLFV